MRIFAGVPLSGGVKWQWGLSTTAIFGDLGGYFFVVRDKTSIITWRYATPCLPVIDCKMNDLEWPWVPISRQSPFSTSKAVARLPLRQLSFLVFLSQLLVIFWAFIVTEQSYGINCSRSTNFRVLRHNAYFWVCCCCCCAVAGMVQDRKTIPNRCIYSWAKNRFDHRRASQAVFTAVAEVGFKFNTEDYLGSRSVGSRY